MTRKHKLILNTATSFLRQIIVIVCGFIVPRQILMSFGNDVYGLVASITQFLSFISFLELGIGPVIQSNLYKPLADGDYESISKVVKSSNSFFRKLATAFLIYIGILFIIYPKIVNSNFDGWYTSSLILIISISTFAEYYFGTTYTLLLNADQKVYIISLLNIITVLLNTFFCIILIRSGCSIHIVKLVASFIFVTKPLFLNIYVNKKYRIDKDIILSEEPIKQKWNGFAQHLAATISNNIDIVLLTMFTSIVNVSIYSIYYNVTNGIANVILITVAGLESYWGNMIAKNEKEELTQSFDTIECVIHAFNTCIFVTTAIMITPFVNVYVTGIKNAEVYNVPLFGMALVSSYYMMSLRIPYFRIIKASGHYKQTQMGSIISMILNVVISTILVFKYGLMGVAFGTFVAFAFHTFYLAMYIRCNIIYRSITFFIKHMLIDLLTILTILLVTSFININPMNYFQWFMDAIIVFALAILVTMIISFIFYRNQLMTAILFIKKQH